jgi:imidazolonepropionase-like amidohydrolase
MQAIQTATVNAAEVLGIADDVGALQSGMVAAMSSRSAVIH